MAGCKTDFDRENTVATKSKALLTEQTAPLCPLQQTSRTEKVTAATKSRVWLAEQTALLCPLQQTSKTRNLQQVKDTPSHLMQSWGLAT